MVRRKKEPVKPVVAKPLNDTEKRNLVTSFVTNNVSESVNNNVSENESNNLTNNDTSKVTNNITYSEIQNDTNKVTNNVTDVMIKNDTNNGTDNGTNEVTNNDNNLDTINSTNNDTKSETKRRTKNVTKTVTMIKTISIGKKEITAKFTSPTRLRPNYNLSEDTIEKIEKVSDILGYKKAEFLDIYLNGTLEKVLKDLEKNNK